MSGIVWHTSLEDLKRTPCSSRQAWLSKPYILSETLKKVAPDLYIRVLNESVLPLASSEQSALATSETKAYVREVFLQDAQPFVFGKIIVPYALFNSYRDDILSIGPRAFGKAFLYDNPHVQRSAFEYAYVSKAEIRQISEHLNESMDQLFARRSFFYLDQQALMVIEVFLSTLPSYPK